MLYIFGGLPGTGKSTLAKTLARPCNAAYLRIDTVEQSVRDSGLSVDGPIGYNIAYHLALDNLRLGMSVVADSVNPIGITRRAWRDVAAQANVPFVEIEIICSDPGEHQKRIESRHSDIPRLQLPTWQDVIEREYEPWDTEPIRLDTAGQSPDESASYLLDAIRNRELIDR
jgi:predicted kinase